MQHDRYETANRNRDGEPKKETTVVLNDEAEYSQVRENRAGHDAKREQRPKPAVAGRHQQNRGD